MRWTYVKPEKKEFVSDGTKVYSYIPLDQRVIVTGSPGKRGHDAGAISGGNGDIVRDFTSAAAEPAVPGTVASQAHAPQERPGIRAPGREHGPQYPANPRPDHPGPAGGQSTMTFTNLKENTGISDKEFAFRVPRGVDVITNGQRN